MYKEMRQSHRFFLVLLAIGSIKTGVTDGEKLYQPGDHVVILNGTLFDTTIYNSESAWIVEFYSSWCGHCIRFAPTWKKLASFVKAWHSVINVAVVDCSAEYNNKLCRDHKIEMYPTIKLFSRQHKRGEKPSVLNSEDQNVNKIKEAMIDHISKQTDSQQIWPWLFPISSMEKVWKEVPEYVKHVVMVFEPQGSYLGQEIILSMVPYQQSLAVRRMYQDGVKKYGLSRFPSMYKLHRSGEFELILQEETVSRPYILQLKSLLGLKEDGSHNVKDSSPVTKNVDKSKQYNDGVLVPVHMQDLESGLHYSFRQEICLKNSMTGPVLRALKDYINVLVKYFPGRPVVMSYLRKIHGWLQDVRELSGSLWLTYINSVENEKAFLPKITKWIACRGSDDKYRGYPCSLWTIFHVLTVQAVEVNKDNADFEAAEVLLAMKGYITNFFGCYECSKNFGKMASKIETGVSDENYGMHWLWEAHNKANKRLHGDESEDPGHYKVQFPTYDSCPSCHQTKPRTNQEPSTWDSKNVDIFLKKRYGRAGIILDTEENKFTLDAKYSISKISFENKEKKQLDLKKLKFIKQSKVDAHVSRLKLQNKNITYDIDRVQRIHKIEEKYKVVKNHSVGVLSSWGFNTIDLSMCVLLYIMGGLIVVMVYFHLAVRRKMGLGFCKKCMV